MVLQYETAMGCENLVSTQTGSEDVELVLSAGENAPSVQPVAYHMVNRRYSEFLNLQTRLEEKAELRKLIKGKIVKMRGTASRRFRGKLKFTFNGFRQRSVASECIEESDL